MTDHPITPPPELVQEWANQSPIQHSDETWAYELFIAHQAARWGADQELEACCQWQDTFNYQNASNLLRAARRPKPPSLKERALQAWAAVEAGTDDQAAMAVIRRALEALPE